MMLGKRFVMLLTQRQSLNLFYNLFFQNDRCERLVADTKTRYNRLFTDYKKYAAEIKRPKTGGRPAPTKPKGCEIFEKELAGDLRIEGIGEDNEAGE